MKWYGLVVAYDELTTAIEKLDEIEDRAAGELSGLLLGLKDNLLDVREQLIASDRTKSVEKNCILCNKKVLRSPYVKFPSCRGCRARDNQTLRAKRNEKYRNEKDKGQKV